MYHTTTVYLHHATTVHRILLNGKLFHNSFSSYKLQNFLNVPYKTNCLHRDSTIKCKHYADNLFTARVNGSGKERILIKLF